MKTLKLFFIALISISALLLLSCKDNGEISEPDLNLNAEYLKQTGWEGTYIDGESKENPQVKIKILFTTENRGSATEYYGERFYDFNFRYSVDSKLITITEYGMLKGDWLVVEKSKDRLVLNRGLGDKYTLDLKRIY